VPTSNPLPAIAAFEFHISPTAVFIAQAARAVHSLGDIRDVSRAKTRIA
jgi:hypothetical protein